MDEIVLSARRARQIRTLLTVFYGRQERHQVVEFVKEVVAATGLDRTQFTRTFYDETMEELSSYPFPENLSPVARRIMTECIAIAKRHAVEGSEPHVEVRTTLAKVAQALHTFAQRCRTSNAEQQIHLVHETVVDIMYLVFVRDVNDADGFSTKRQKVFDALHGVTRLKKFAGQVAWLMRIPSLILMGIQIASVFDPGFVGTINEIHEKSFPYKCEVSWWGPLPYWRSCSGGLHDGFYITRPNYIGKHSKNFHTSGATDGYETVMSQFRDRYCSAEGRCGIVDSALIVFSKHINMLMHSTYALFASRRAYVCWGDRQVSMIKNMRIPDVCLGQDGKLPRSMKSIFSTVGDASFDFVSTVFNQILKVGSQILSQNISTQTSIILSVSRVAYWMIRSIFGIHKLPAEKGKLTRDNILVYITSRIFIEVWSNAIATATLMLYDGISTDAVMLTAWTTLLIFVSQVVGKVSASLMKTTEQDRKVIEFFQAVTDLGDAYGGQGFSTLSGGAEEASQDSVEDVSIARDVMKLSNDMFGVALDADVMRETVADYDMLMTTFQEPSELE